MHESVRTFVEQQQQRYGLNINKSVIEIGSQDVNGSVRDLFGPNYWGIDPEDGPGVDQVVDLAGYLAMSIEQFDVVLCLEMLEHDKHPWESMQQAHDLVAPGGMMILTTRGIGFQFHEYPIDCTRWTRDGIYHLLDWAGWHNIEVYDDPQVSGVFVVANA